MADPKLTKASVQMSYTADDGYSMQTGFKSGQLGNTPEQAMLGALEELTRLCCLFGFEQQAREKFDGAAGRVREWRENREPA